MYRDFPFLRIMNKRFVTTVLAVSATGLGSYYYGGYNERQRILQNLPLYEQQQVKLLHKVCFQLNK